MSKPCLFCGRMTDLVIDHNDPDDELYPLKNPICSVCRDVYEAGQASPDAEIAEDDDTSI